MQEHFSSASADMSVQTQKGRALAKPVRECPWSPLPRESAERFVAELEEVALVGARGLHVRAVEAVAKL